MKKTICWQKWISPYSDDDDTMKNFKQQFLEDFMKNVDDDGEIEEGDLEYEDKQKKLPFPPMLLESSSQIKVMSTPMGIIPLTENTDASKIFNFWIGHSNFNISEDVANVIGSVSGVETLDIWTRYRIRVGIGKHPDFGKDRDILHNIEKAIQEI